jgi:hypothetical protein
MLPDLMVEPGTIEYDKKQVDREDLSAQLHSSGFFIAQIFRSVHLFEPLCRCDPRAELTGDAAALADVGASSRANCKATSARIPAGWLRLATRRAEWFFAACA